MKGLTVMENNSQKQALLQIGKLLSEFLKQLAGDHSDEWLQAFKKFLRKENPWEKRIKSEEKNKTNGNSFSLHKRAANQRTAINLGTWLKENGYSPTESPRYFIESKNYQYPWNIDGIGILLGEREYKFPLFKFWKIRRPMIGCIFFTGETWQFKGYGELYISKAEELCKQLEEKFKKKIEIILEDVFPKEETFPRDFIGSGY